MAGPKPKRAPGWSSATAEAIRCDTECRSVDRGKGSPTWEAAWASLMVVSRSTSRDAPTWPDPRGRVPRSAPTWRARGETGPPRSPGPLARARGERLYKRSEGLASAPPGTTDGESVEEGGEKDPWQAGGNLSDREGGIGRSRGDPRPFRRERPGTGNGPSGGPGSAPPGRDGSGSGRPPRRPARAPGSRPTRAPRAPPSGRRGAGGAASRCGRSARTG